MAKAIYAKTRAGEVELKVVPARRAFEATSRLDFFEARNELFRRDFEFLKRNSLSMTVPVEAEVRPGAMRFLLASKRDPAEPVPGVELVTKPKASVVSAGLRGGYTRANYERGLARIDEWLRRHDEYDRAGAPYAVYWNGPLVPWLLRRSEVHQPVVRIPAA